MFVVERAFTLAHSESILSEWETGEMEEKETNSSENEPNYNNKRKKSLNYIKHLWNSTTDKLGEMTENNSRITHNYLERA